MNTILAILSFLRPRSAAKLQGFIDGKLAGKVCYDTWSESDARKAHYANPYDLGSYLGSAYSFGFKKGQAYTIRTLDVTVNDPSKLRAVKSILA